MLEDTIILIGIDEIGRLFLNRSLKKIKIKSILAKDYPVEYSPIKIFEVSGNSRKLVFEPFEEYFEDSKDNETKQKWIKSVYEGAIRALYRANLDDVNLSPDDYSDVPTEKQIFWEALNENEATIIPDTSSLMDGLISRLVESEEYEDEYVKILNVFLSPTVLKELQKHAMGRQKKISDWRND